MCAPQRCLRLDSQTWAAYAGQPGAGLHSKRQSEMSELSSNGGAACGVPAAAKVTLSGVVNDTSRLRKKGFGFILPDKGGKNVFFHVSGPGNANSQSLSVGQAVTFCEEHGIKGPCATFITLGQTQPPQNKEELGGWLQYIEEQDAISECSLPDRSRRNQL